MKLSQSEQDRLAYIDCAKGIGILLVVVAHHLQDADNIRCWIHSFHIPLFFIITGYLLAWRPRSFTIRQAFASQAKSLLYPYITFSITLILWLVVFCFVFDTSPDEPFTRIILRTLTTYGYHALWFLPALFFSSWICKVCKNKWHWLLALIALVGACVIAHAIYSENLFLGWLRYPAMYLGRILIAVTFIEIGRNMYSLLQKLNGTMSWFLIAILFGFSLLYFRMNDTVSMAFARIGNPLLYYVNACAGSFGILLLSKKLSHTGIRRLFNFWGRNSLIVMALHMDISIEIAWLLLGITKLSSILSFRAASICAILIELPILAGMIVFINQYMPFLIRFPNFHISKHCHEEK